MTCSIKSVILDNLESKGMISTQSGAPVVTAPVTSLMNESRRLSMQIMRDFGEDQLPFLVDDKGLQMNESMFLRIQNEEATVSRSPKVQRAEEEVLSTMRHAMKQFGVKETIVDRLRDHEGRPIKGVAAANILRRAVEYTVGKESEIPEEVMHFYVVALAESKDPLYNSMLERIQSHPEYDETVKKYTDFENYTQEDIVDEAITMVVLNRVKNAIDDREGRWWKRVWRWVQSKFSPAGDPFRQAALNLLTKDLSQYAKVIEGSNREVIFRSQGTPQEQARQLFIDKHNKLKLVDFDRAALEGKIDPRTLDLAEDENGIIIRYEYEGEMLNIRASDWSSILMLRSVGSLKDMQYISESERAQIASVGGTNLHSVGENILMALASSTKLHYHKHINFINVNNRKIKSFSAIQREHDIPVPFFNIYKREMEALLESMVKKQKENKAAGLGDGRIDLFLELKVASMEESTGGTLDVMFLDQAAHADIFDFKFFFPQKGDLSKKSKRPLIVIDPLRGAREEGYEHQMGKYIRALMQEYGILNVDRSQLIPGHVRYKYVKGVLTNEIEFFDMGSEHDRFLMHFPLVREMTGLGGIDAKLDELYDRKDKLKRKKRTPAVEREKELLTSTIKDLINREDMKYTFYEVKDTLAYAYEGLKITDPDDKNYLETGEIADLVDLLGVFGDLSMVAAERAAQIKDKDKRKAFLDRLKDSDLAVGDMRKRLWEEGLRRLMSRSPFHLGTKKKSGWSVTPSKPADMLQGTLTMGAMDNEFYKAAYDIYIGAREDQDKAYRKHRDKWLDLEEDMQEWANDHTGGDIRKVYSKLIRATEYGYKLVTMFSDEFRKEREDIIESVRASESKVVKTRALKYMKDRHEIRSGAKEEFKTARAAYAAKMVINHRGEDTPAYKAAMDWYDNNFDVWHKDSAWISPKFFVYLDVKKSVAKDNYSTEYTELTRPGNEDLLGYYNEWKEQIRFFKELMKGKSLNPDMVPSLLRGVVETTMTGGNPFNTMKNKFVRSITIDTENEENIGKEASKSIPLRYMAPPRKEDGSVDIDMISVDLTRSMIEFGDAVFEYVENSKIEGDLLLIRHLLTMSRTAKMDGKHIIRDSRGNVKTDDPSSEVLAVYDTLLNMMLYKNMAQNADATIDLFGRKVSWNKVLTELKSAYSKSRLTLPIKAAIGAGASGTIFRKSKAIDSPNYSLDSLAKGTKLLWENRKLYFALAEVFDVHQEDMRELTERRLRGDTASKYMNSSYLYYPLIPMDEMGDRVLLMGMLFHHGLDKDGNLKRLEDLPEGTLSIAETAKMDKNGKLTGVPKHEVLFNMKMRFMSEVQGVRGDMSPYNIALYRSNVYIGLLMQFKTWMPAMVEDRLGMTKFDIYKDAFKTGRYRATWNAGGLFQKNMPETEEGVTEELAWSALAVSKLKALQGLIHTSVKLNSYTLAKKEKERLDAEGKWSPEAEARYERRRAFVGRQLKYTRLDSLDPRMNNMSEEAFMEMQQRAIRSAIAEIRAVLYLLLFNFVLGAAWEPEDDEGKYARTKTMDLLSRVLLESGMFINPAEITKLNQSGVPLLGMLQDLTSSFTNTGDILYDLATVGKWTNPGDKSGPFHYLLKFAPGVNAYRWVTKGS